MEERITIEKELSKNDVGVTGSHQAGILIPKKEELLRFFPELDKSLENPRVSLSFWDDSNTVWHFNLIYYNNSFRGGTRNEYRLTGMTKYIRSCNLSAGDKLIMERQDGQYRVSYKRKSEVATETDDSVIRLTINSWKMVSYE